MARAHGSSFCSALAHGIGGPVGIVIGANLGAGQTERAVKASWIGVLMACTLTESIGLAAAAFPQQWIGIFSQDPSVLEFGAEYLHRVGPFFWILGSAMFFIASDRGTGRMGASVLAGLLRTRHRGARGFVVVWLKADVTWNFVAVALGMVAFGLFALPPLVNRSGYE
jgi:Na+-driven multidrug efflux pump